MAEVRDAINLDEVRRGDKAFQTVFVLVGVAGIDVEQVGEFELDAEQLQVLLLLERFAEAVDVKGLQILPTAGRLAASVRMANCTESSSRVTAASEVPRVKPSVTPRVMATWVLSVMLTLMLSTITK